jgi:hypothetical protein
MESKQIHPLPVAVNGRDDESGISFAYRTMQANGLSLRDAQNWLQLKSWNALRLNDLSALAWITRAGNSWLAHRTIISLGNQVSRHYGFMGHEFGEGAANFTHRARLCPICVKRQKYVRAGWQLHCISGCGEHNSTLLERCPHCGLIVSWNRPAIDICSCGRFLTISSEAAKLPNRVVDWINWIEIRLADASAIWPASSFGLPGVLDNLTIDGAYRLVLATGFLASPGEPISSATERARTSIGMAEVISRGLDRLVAIGREPRDISALEPVIHLPVLERMKTHSVAPKDSSCANFLIDCLRQQIGNNSEKRGRYRRGQLPLFP